MRVSILTSDGDDDESFAYFNKRSARSAASACLSFPYFSPFPSLLCFHFQVFVNSLLMLASSPPLTKYLRPMPNAKIISTQSAPRPHCLPSCCGCLLFLLLLTPQAVVFHIRPCQGKLILFFVGKLRLTCRIRNVN